MLEISVMNYYKKVKKTATIPRTKIINSNKIMCTVENTSKEAQETKLLHMIGTPQYLFKMIKIGFWEACQRR